MLVTLIIIGLLVLIAWNTTDTEVKTEIKTCANNIKQIRHLRVVKTDKEAS